MLAQLPPFAELDSPQWGLDLDTVTHELFSDPYRGLLRATDGSFVVFSNEQVRALASHPDVSHETLAERSGPFQDDSAGPAGVAVLQRNNPFTARTPVHMPMKQLGARRVTTKSMGRFSEAAESIVHDLIAEASRRDEIDFTEDFAAPLVARFWSEILGMTRVESQEAVRLAGEYHTISVLHPDSAHVARANRAGVGYMELLTAVLEREMANGGHEVLAELAEDVERLDGPWHPEHPCAFLGGFLLDAFHTLVAILVNALHALLSAPTALERIRAERSLVPTAYLEGIRLHPALTFTTRQAVREFEFDGVVIPEDAKLRMMWLFANRDPDVFDEPASFRLERENRPLQITFGGGFYICPGRNVAKLLGEIVLTALTEPSVELIRTEEPMWITGTALHEVARLPVVIRAR